MSHPACRQGISEAAMIMKLCGVKKLWLILHDYVPYFSGWITEADLTKMRLKRGGTSHEGVFKILNRTYEEQEMNFPKHEHIAMVVMFTDLGTDIPKEIPKYEVLWAVPEGGMPGMSADVPYGKKIQIDLQGEAEGE